MYADLDDYLDLARAGPSLSDEQHIFNKLIFDAVNESITECIVDVSFNFLRQQLLPSLDEGFAHAQNVSICLSCQQILLVMEVLVCMCFEALLRP